MQRKLSIGMPAHNGERFIEQAVESILSQSRSDFELIISDNASTDKTAGICAQLAKRDPRIRAVRNQQNQGAAANFNRVFELASGEYFKWACADDLAEPPLVERCGAVLDDRPAVVLCYPQTMLIDDQGGALRAYADGLDLQSADVVDRFQAASAHTGLLNVLQGVMRSPARSSTPLFQPASGAGIALMEELSLHGKLVEQPETLLFRRMHHEATGASASQEDRQERLAPKSRGRLSNWWWRHGWGHAMAVRRAPVPFGTKLKLWIHQARQSYWHRRLLAQEAGVEAFHWLSLGRSLR